MKPPVDVSEIKTAKAFEKFLRDAGFPKSFAMAVTCHGFKAAAGLRDADVAASPEVANAIKSSIAALCEKLKGPTHEAEK